MNVVILTPEDVLFHRQNTVRDLANVAVGLGYFDVEDYQQLRVAIESTVTREALDQIERRLIECLYHYPEAMKKIGV